LETLAKKYGGGYPPTARAASRQPLLFFTEITT
jgi:hypothetical protein